MLSKADRQKLRFGRIILADVPNSSGTASKRHYAVMVDSDEQIAETMEKDKIYVVVPISHDTSIAPEYLVPIPPRAGFTGKFQCAWIAKIHEDAIHSFRSFRERITLTDQEMKPILSMVQQYHKDKAAELARKRAGQSRQS
jgi:hypothetical protein